MPKSRRVSAAEIVKEQHTSQNGKHVESLNGKHLESLAASPFTTAHDSAEHPCSESIVIRTLPDDAKAIAQNCAEDLAVNGLSEPLQDFLTEVSATPGIDGLALVTWSTEKSPPYLSVYALFDRGLPDTRSMPAQLYTSVTQAYGLFARALRRDAFPVSSGLSWVNTKGEDVRCVFSTFEAELADAPTLSLTPTDDLQHLTFAIPRERM